MHPPKQPADILKEIWLRLRTATNANGYVQSYVPEEYRPLAQWVSNELTACEALLRLLVAANAEDRADAEQLYVTALGVMQIADQNEHVRKLRAIQAFQQACTEMPREEAEAKVIREHGLKVIDVYPDKWPGVTLRVEKVEN